MTYHLFGTQPLQNSKPGIEGGADCVRSGGKREPGNDQRYASESSLKACGILVVQVVVIAFGPTARSRASTLSTPIVIPMPRGSIATNRDHGRKPLSASYLARSVVEVEFAVRDEEESVLRQGVLQDGAEDRAEQNGGQSASGGDLYCSTRQARGG